jgi:signal transduction histidine kinase
MMIKNLTPTRENGIAAQNGYLVFLAPPNCPAWLTQLADDMAQAGYHVHSIRHADELAPLMKTLSPDAVVLGDPTAVPSIFPSLAIDSDAAPLRVFVSDDGDADIPAVDVVVPPVAPLLILQLASYLRQREMIQQLKDETEHLRAEIEHQKLLLREYQHTSSEVHLLKNAIVRNVSHELKTPLLHVKSAVAMLAEDNGNNSTLTTYATEAVARLESIVNNITRLAYSIEANMEPVIINEVIDHALRNIRRSWQHKDAIMRIKVSLDDRLPLVRGDKQGLGTVIQLMLDNALKFSEGIVEVSARQRQDGGVDVSIRDHGIGIPADQLDKIFDSFYQVDNSSTRRYGGTGTGLAIVKLILDRHHVQIGVESHQGQGSTFSFHLPPADMQKDW